MVIMVVMVMMKGCGGVSDINQSINPTINQTIIPDHVLSPGDETEPTPVTRLIGLITG